MEFIIICLDKSLIQLKVNQFLIDSKLTKTMYRYLYIVGWYSHIRRQGKERGKKDEKGIKIITLEVRMRMPIQLKKEISPTKKL